MGKDLLGLLFFPGVLFVGACGGAVLFLEGWLRAAFYGGGGPRPRDLSSVDARGRVLSAGELMALAAATAAMGVAGVLLVSMRGDLFVLVLLFPAVEIFPLYPLAAGGLEQSLHVPLLFSTALRRTVVLSCTALAVSLRIPGAFSPGIADLRETGVVESVRLWGGTGFAFITASMACAGIALLLYLLGRPAGTERPLQGGEQAKAFFSAVLEGPHRAVSLLLFALLFLGYPWRGDGGVLLWSVAALGTAVLVTAARAWSGGRGHVLANRLQAAAPAVSMLSAALAFTAVVINGS